MSRVLKQLGYSHIKLLHAPLVEYERFYWYDTPSDMSRIISKPVDLVICDGPPGSTQGGRFGMLPVMQQYLGDQCTVLLDDTHRQLERDTIDAWKNLRQMQVNSTGMTHTELKLR